MNLNPDVLIIGGGPAGSTLATLLARRGHQVVLLEKDQHPRFHIGESLLPMNLPILERLGVLPAVEGIGVMKKGADFTSDSVDSEYRTYLFERSLSDCAGNAFEVKREEFDALLFDHCRETGVETHQRHTVHQVTLGEHGDHRVQSTDAAGHSHEFQPRFLIDATGRDAFLARTHHWSRRNPQHASAAIFGHFQGVERRPGENAGNISVYWHRHGWIWMIPLQNDIMSVGAVCWPDYLKTRRGLPAEEFLMKTMALNPAAAERMQGKCALAPVRVTGNYSYTSSRMGGPGYLLIGDAFAFVDPVFSSGVYLAMNSAERAVPAVELWLSGDQRSYAAASRQYAKTIRRGLKSFSWFIYRFTSPAMRNLMANPRNILKVEQAVISMLAGDVFENREVRRRLWFFRFLYGISWVLTLKGSFSARRRRRANARGEALPDGEIVG